MKRIRKGDQVIVITGQDKGKIGHIVAFGNQNDRVVVSGVNVRKKSVKAHTTNGQMEEGGFKNVELPIHISNIALYDPESKCAAKVSFIMQEENGKKEKIRCFRSTQKPIIQNKN